MISCEQCQKKLAAIYDNEGCKEDVELTNAHLKDCPSCRAFQEDMVKLRQRFTSIAVPGLPKTVEKELMQTVRGDSLRSPNQYYDDGLKYRSALFRMSPVVRMAGLAGLLLLIISWLACFVLAGEVSNLRGRLETSRQELAAANQELAVARAEKQLEENREREQKAITALYLRMAELESRFEKYSSPRNAYFQTE